MAAWTTARQHGRFARRREWDAAGLEYVTDGRRHVEVGAYLLGGEADASYTWSWSGQNGYEGGKGEATASATFGTVGSEEYLYGRASGSYALEFFECGKG